jgi:hypothetical protein
MKGKTRFPTFQGSRGTTVLEGLAQKDPNADLLEKSSSVSSCNVPWKGGVGESESRDQVYSRDALLSLYRPQSLPQSLLSFYPGLDPDGAEDSSCDALKEIFNDFGNDGTDQYDQFGDLRSEVAQQYIASNSLSSNANLLLSTTRQEDSASNIITQQLRELKGRHSYLYVCIYLPDSVILRWRTCSTWFFSTWVCSTRICSTEQ